MALPPLPAVQTVAPAMTLLSTSMRSTVSAITQVEVPLAERRAYLAWASNKLGPGRSVVADASGVVRASSTALAAFRRSRERVRLLVQTQGVISTPGDFGRAVWRMWRAADQDGLAAYDRDVVPGVPFVQVGSFDAMLGQSPGALGGWFVQAVADERAMLGVPVAVAIGNVEARGIPAGSRDVFLGFNLERAASGQAEMGDGTRGCNPLVATCPDGSCSMFDMSGAGPTPYKCPGGVYVNRDGSIVSIDSTGEDVAGGQPPAATSRNALIAVGVIGAAVVGALVIKSLL